MDIRQTLLSMGDAQYADFTARLTPTIRRETCIGVRLPVLRKFEKQLRGTGEAERFLDALPHGCFEENMLHALLLCNLKDYGETVRRVDAFLPCVDNWAVCDTLSPKVFAEHRAELIGEAVRWAASKETYTCRFGIGVLMRHFLDEEFRGEYLELAAGVQSEEYYVNMMLAWYFATALAKQYDAAVPYLEERRLSPWVHRKTIQKAVESYRITDAQKAYLKTLRRQGGGRSGGKS